MAFEIAMPRMGVTMEEGTVLKWLKRVGDTVDKEEPILEIETDKVTIVVPSDAEGVLLSIVVPEGKQVPVGTLLAWVGQAGEEVPGAKNSAAPVVAVGEEPPKPTPTLGTAVPELSSGAAGRVRATPAARSRARVYGIELASLRGTSPSGRIHARDVEAARAVPQGPVDARPAIPPSAMCHDVPVTGIRKVIAERMAQSFHSTVPVLLTAEIVMDRVEELLAQLGTEFQKKVDGKTGYLPLIVKAAGFALRAHPRMNAHWLGSAIRLFEGEIHIGVAVSLEAGLTVPVLKHADRKGLVEIASEVKALAVKARQGSLALSDLEGATFTISNLGAYHIGFFMPVINAPQVAILGVGQAVRKPVARDEKVQVLPVLPLSLVFDHRAIDGAPAAAFLDTIKLFLEEPFRMLL